MGLFRRNQAGDNADASQASEKSKKRPANTAFKQQRLKAWQPILTPKTVLPTLFIIGILFAPIGGLLVWGSGLVTEITIDYTNCDTLQSAPDASTATSQLVDVPNYSYRLRASDNTPITSKPQYALISSGNQTQCLVNFQIPYDLKKPVLLYYKLTNFFQNHRRYVQSFDTDQLLGRDRSPGQLDSGNCKPVAKDGQGNAIYPCGLIANSLFNDTFSNLTLLDPPQGASSTYPLSERGIAWPGESKKYSSKPSNSTLLVPPPNWLTRYPNGYTPENPIPDLAADEHFQNWMRTAGLPTFSKLYGRNDDTDLIKGNYQILVDLNFPVRPYSGTKSIVISTVSWIGGKNPFLGYAYVAAASLFVALGIAGTIRHLVKPRRLGDMSLLSWNRT